MYRDISELFMYGGIGKNTILYRLGDLSGA